MNIDALILVVVPMTIGGAFAGGYAAVKSAGRRPLTPPFELRSDCVIRAMRKKKI